MGHFGGRALLAPAHQAEAHRVMINVAAAQRELPDSPHADYYGALLSAHRNGVPLVRPDELKLIDAAARRSGVHPARVVETLRDTTDREAKFKNYDWQIEDAQANARLNDTSVPETGLGSQMFAVREILGAFQGNGPAGKLAIRLHNNSAFLRQTQRAFGVGQGTAFGQVLGGRQPKGPVYLPPREKPGAVGGLPAARPQTARGQVRRTQNRGRR